MVEQCYRDKQSPDSVFGHQALARAHMWAAIDSIHKEWLDWVFYDDKYGVVYQLNYKAADKNKHVHERRAKAAREAEDRQQEERIKRAKEIAEETE